MSVADAENVTAAPDGPVASSVIFEGTVTVGGVVSTTVTLNEPCPVLPCASVALHDTSVVPSAKIDPECGVHVVLTLPSTMSVADAENVTAAPDGPVASSVMFAGTSSEEGRVGTAGRS